MKFPFPLLISIVTIFPLSMACDGKEVHLEESNQSNPRSSTASTGHQAGGDGFGWAYALTAYLESFTKHKQGQRLNLSEEAIAFHRIAIELYYIANHYSAEEIKEVQDLDHVLFEGLQGFNLKYSQSYHPDFGRGGALALIDRFGVIPENAWTPKLGLLDDASFLGLLKSRFVKFLQKHRGRFVTEDRIRQFLASDDLLGSAPPRIFSYKISENTTLTMSPHKYLRQVVSYPYAAEEIELIEARSAKDFEALTTKIKKSLYHKTPIPVSFAVDPQRAATNGSMLILRESATLNPKAANSMLIYDYVNRGGFLGSARMSLFELYKPTSALSFVVAKNSWSKKTRWSSQQWRKAWSGSLRKKKPNFNHVEAREKQEQWILDAPHRLFDVEIPEGEIAITSDYLKDAMDITTPGYTFQIFIPNEHLSPSAKQE